MKKVLLIVLALANYPLFAQNTVGDFKIKVKNNAVISVHSDDQGYISINKQTAFKHDLYLYSPDKKLVSTLNIPYGKNHLGKLYGISSLEDRLVYYYPNPDNPGSKIDAYVLLRNKNAVNGMISGITVLNEKEKSIINSFSVNGEFLLVISNTKTNEIEFLSFESTDTYRTYPFALSDDDFKSITKSSFQFISREEELMINKTYHSDKIFYYGNSVYFVKNNSRKNSNKVAVYEFDLQEMDNKTKEFNVDLNVGSSYNSFLLDEYLFTYTVNEKKFTLDIYNYISETQLKRYLYNLVDSLSSLPSNFYNGNGSNLANLDMVRWILNDRNNTPAIACSKLDDNRFMIRFGIYSPAATKLATGPDYNYMVDRTTYFSAYGETVFVEESFNYFEIVFKPNSFELEQERYPPSPVDKMNRYLGEIEEEGAGCSNEQLIYHMGSMHLIHYDKGSKSIKLVEL